MTEKAWEIKSVETMSRIQDEAAGNWPFIAESEKLQDIASFFKGFSDETRMKIITLLWEHDLCMCEISSALGVASSTVSHHLKILEKGKVITSRKEGKFTIYHVDQEVIRPLLEYWKEGKWNV